MKNSKKFVKTAFVRTVLAVLFAAGVFSLAGCGRTGDDSKKADTAVQHEIPETEPESMGAQTDAATAKMQGGEEGSAARAYSDGEAGGAARAYSDKEKEHVADSKVWTQEMVDEADRKDRAIREEKIKASGGGISEEEAIEIARKAMETDMGEKAKELEVCIYPEVMSFGWKLRLYDITDWEEYKGKGEVAYSVEFNNAGSMENPEDFEDYITYQCMVNAVDGSICGAYSLGWDLDIDKIVWYEH